MTEPSVVRRTDRPIDRRTDRQAGGGFAFASTMLRPAFVDGERQWHTRRQSFAAESLPTVDLALLAGPALFARLHDDRTFNVRAQTIGGARTSSAPGPPLSGAPFIFSTMGTGAIHRRDRIRTSVNPPVSSSLFRRRIKQHSLFCLRRSLCYESSGKKQKDDVGILI